MLAITDIDNIEVGDVILLNEDQIIVMNITEAMDEVLYAIKWRIGRPNLSGYDDTVTRKGLKQLLDTLTPLIRKPLTGLESL